MSNYLIRYANIQHGNDVYNDYLLSGINKITYKLSIDAKINMIRAMSTFSEVEKIYSGTEQHTIETAKQFAKIMGVTCFRSNKLDNIRYDFSRLLTREEWNNNPESLISLRKRFITAFFSDDLIDSKTLLINRFSRLKKFLDTNDHVLMITHGVILKLFYLYIKTEFNMKLDKIIDLAKADEPFYAPLKGYSYPELVEI